VDEVLSAKGQVKKIKNLMEDAKKKFDSIQSQLSLAVKGYQRLDHILNTSEADAQKEIDEKRRERDDLIQQYSYSLVQPVAWKLVDDYSRFSRP
jgi:hypothetical protein